MAPQTEYGNFAASGDWRNPIGRAGQRGKTERPVVRETSRRRERGQRNGSETFGHGHSSDRSPLPRRVSFSGAVRAPLPDSTAGLPELDAAFWKIVDDGAAALGLDLSPAVRSAIGAHVRLLIAWNAAINLTALRTPEQIARGHVLDSLVALPAIRALADPRSLLDLGSGGGFPGFPLAITMPVARAALVDSVAKKARFLAVVADVVTAQLESVGASAPQLTALAERAEDLADEPDQRESWDLVVARAVGSVAEVAELGLPLVRIGGRVVTWKRDDGQGALAREIGAGVRVANAAGGNRPRIVRLPAAGQVGLAGHCLVVIDKRRTTPLRYPRPAGERQRAPC
jgi:16S rRNA (guanine527-N7)-methyltransferase